MKKHTIHSILKLTALLLVLCLLPMMATAEQAEEDNSDWVSFLLICIAAEECERLDTLTLQDTKKCGAIFPRSWQGSLPEKRMSGRPILGSSPLPLLDKKPPGRLLPPGRKPIKKVAFPPNITPIFGGMMYSKAHTTGCHHSIVVPIVRVVF